MRLEPRLVTLLALSLGAGMLPALAADPVPPELVEAVRAQVLIDTTPGSTRLVLTHDRPVQYAVHAAGDRLRIVYHEPVDVRPPEQRLDDPILERYRLRDSRTIVLWMGKSYTSYETFELQNPFRLIVDLRSASGGNPRRDDKKPPQPTTILVVDPGHGGAEHGAIGPAGLLEKDVTLELASELKRVLERTAPSISVVLTRDEDRAVGLDERTAVANHNRADLFLSIHLNASPRSEARGAETYYLSTAATDDEARTLAALENRAPHVEGAPPAPLEWVLWDLAQNQYLAESAALAGSVQRQLNVLTGTRDRGVRQAPFRVLMGAMMPAILVEVGFISNRDEEALFQTTAHRTEVVTALSAAVQEFLKNLEHLAAPEPARTP